MQLTCESSDSRKVSSFLNYSKSNSTQSPVSGAGSISEPTLMSQVRRLVLKIVMQNDGDSVDVILL